MNNTITISDIERQKLRQLGLAVINLEATAVADLSSRVNDDFVLACQFMLSCKGR